MRRKSKVRSPWLSSTPNAPQFRSPDTPRRYPSVLTRSPARNRTGSSAPECLTNPLSTLLTSSTCPEQPTRAMPTPQFRLLPATSQYRNSYQSFLLATDRTQTTRLLSAKRESPIIDRRTPVRQQRSSSTHTLPMADLTASILNRTARKRGLRPAADFGNIILPQ
jgi:hypothetical protein